MGRRNLAVIRRFTMGLRYLTAGESHGAALTGILEGMPSGVEVVPECFASLLRRRRAGYGRGARQKIETDEVTVTAGLRAGYTTGAPIALQIGNAEFTSPGADGVSLAAHDQSSAIHVPLPGHADLPGIVKYGLSDCRNIRERASARETVMRTALSVPPRCLLEALEVRSLCLVECLGGITASIDYNQSPAALAELIAAGGDDFMTPDLAIIQSWKRLVDSAASDNASLGGTAAVIFWNLPIGLGSHTQHDLRLDSRLAGLLMSIPAVRGVEIGMALQQASGDCPAADPIAYDSKNGWSRMTNYAGGLEGGMSNGAPLLLRFHMKPLPANARVDSVDLRSGQLAQPEFYRSDTQAITAAAVVAESIIAIELASQLVKMTGGETLQQVSARLARLREEQKRLPGS
ncbi:MAG: chorismate synthase [Candidatus Riflebacteria bacterium HGW-Riflebacteria-1]|nr:MAG: chorismate synthase [Candidatus Riflebacteria bacterium HGW-Riflebacteria-1]